MKKILSVFTMILTALTISNARAEENNMNGKKVLVAYFTLTGNTEKAAKIIAEENGADLYQIEVLLFS